MTDKQRVEALLRREKPDRVPIYPFALGFDGLCQDLCRGCIQQP